MVALAGTGILAIAVAAVWTYGSGERTYYGPHTGILHTGDTVVVAEDFYADWSRQAIMSFSSVKS